METKQLSIEKIEIETFKKIRDLVIEPEMGANFFFGSFRSGKTSLCEFIQFILYGADSVALARDNAEDALGKIHFLFDGKKFLVERSVIGGKEELSFLDGDTGLPVETKDSPGQFFTGMDHVSFDLVTYFKQARYETPVFKPKFSFLNYLSGLNRETENIYQNEMVLKEKSEKFCTQDKTGSLDRLLEKREQIQKRIKERPEWEETAEMCAKSLKEIAEKLDENDKRCVLLKADMASFEDDLKLARNLESAEDLKTRIQAKEKSFRISLYDVTHKIGLLKEDELEEMRQDYNLLSLSLTGLAEARAALASSEENLAFHKRLFSGKMNREHFEGEKKRIRKNKWWRLGMRILGILLVGAGISLYFLLSYLKFDFVICLAAALASLLCGVALACVSTLFSSFIRRILHDNGTQSLEEFNETFEKICAHEKTTLIYQEKVKWEEDVCQQKTKEKEAITARIFEKVSALGYGEEDGELLAICDQIIEANDALYDLKREIEEDSENYKKILSTDVESKTLRVSDEFAALQKEVSFLSVQNDSLYKKKALLSARLQEAEDILNQTPEEMEAELIAIQAEIDKETEEFQALELDLTLAVEMRKKFEDALKLNLTRMIGEKISFVLGKGESFLFDENFELCFRDQDSILPLIKAGGGVISEMGLLAFRLSLAEMMGKTSLPMIFDDSFSMLSREDAEKLYRVLQKSCSQYFVTTSSPDLIEICQDSAKVIRL